VGPGPCIDLAFGPTAKNDYWSSTSVINVPTQVALVDFSLGAFVGGIKTPALYVRAVRGVEYLR
jgi:hypothetical protein